MQVVMKKFGNVTVVLLPGGALEADNSTEFERDIELALRVSPRVVFDLSQLQFVDRSGLGAILFCLLQLKASGGDLKLCETSQAVSSLLETAQLHKILDIFKTREEAVGAFQN